MRTGMDNCMYYWVILYWTCQQLNAELIIKIMVWFSLVDLCIRVWDLYFQDFPIWFLLLVVMGLSFQDLPIWLLLNFCSLHLEIWNFFLYLVATETGPMLLWSVKDESMANNISPINTQQNRKLIRPINLKWTKIE